MAMFDVTVRGVTPLLTHNGRLSDPLDDVAIELKRTTAKKKKTDEDHALIADLEWKGGVYTDDDDNCTIPPMMAEACLIEAAKRFKLGKQAKASIFCVGVMKFSADGPRRWQDRIKDRSCRLRSSVVVNQRRVMRTRPIFRNWSCTFRLNMSESKMDVRQLEDIAKASGDIGFGDWRPRYGQFVVESVKQVK